MSNTLPKILMDTKSVSLPVEEKVFRVGDNCTHFYFLQQGSVRVDLITHTGKPVTLYRFGSGETCILTTSCLLSGEPYCAEAIVETPVKAAAMPVERFKALLTSSSEMRELVFTSFASRLSVLMHKIESLTTMPIEQRLAQRVLELSEQNLDIRITHEVLAADIGSSREVVSRKLAEWNLKGWITRSRGGFRVENPDQIERLA